MLKFERKFRRQRVNTSSSSHLKGITSYYTYITVQLIFTLLKFQLLFVITDPPLFLCKHGTASNFITSSKQCNMRQFYPRGSRDVMRNRKFNKTFWVWQPRQMVERQVNQRYENHPCSRQQSPRKLYT